VLVFLLIVRQQCITALFPTRRSSDLSFGWGPQDDQVSQNTMRHAIELGVNWIDTAAVYGLGHSERVVGRFLRSLPPSDRPFIFTDRKSTRLKSSHQIISYAVSC